MAAIKLAISIFAGLAIIVFIIVVSVVYAIYKQDLIDLLVEIYKSMRRVLANILNYILLIGTIVGIMTLMVVACHFYSGLPIWWQEAIEVFNTHNVIAGFLTTILGLIFVYALLHPHITIDPTLAIYHRQEGETKSSRIECIRLQICNNGIFDLYDVQIELKFYRESQDEDIKTQQINLNVSEVPVLRNMLWGKKYSYYVVSSEKSFNWDDRYTNIRCRVMATHSLSGVRTTTEHMFAKENVKEGRFYNFKFVKK